MASDTGSDSPAPRRGLSVRRLLLGVNALVLVVPLVATFFAGVYANYLVRTTERRLIAESVLVGEAWRDRWLEALGRTPADAGRTLAPEVDDLFDPIEPVLDLNRGVDAPEPPSVGFAAADEPARLAGIAIEPLLHRAKLVNLSAVRVLDAQGCVVATTGSQLGACLDHLEEVRKALAGEYAAVARRRFSDEPPPPLSSMSRRGKVRVFTATPIRSDGRVVGVVRMSRTSIDPVEALWEHRRAALWSLLACLVLTVTISVFFARAIVRPVREITAAAKAIAGGRTRRPLRPGGRVPAEVHDLSAALDMMTIQLSDRSRYIAEFAANVSHELKTPLTGILGATELLRDDWAEMDDAQRQRFLDNIDEDARRMERRVTQMLGLARIQSAPEEAAHVPLRTLFEALAARYGGRVRLDLAEAPTSVEIHPDHFESAVRNLVDNAVRHGDGQPVDVTVATASDRIAVSVRDRGRGISEGNRDRVFDRFFTTERDRGGSGLGLAIVRAVAETRGGRVWFETGHGGTTFWLVL